VTTESLPRHDVARPVLRLAFTVAWTIGALLAMAIIVTVANATASPPPSATAACAGLDAPGARAGAAASVRQAPVDACLPPANAGAAPGTGRPR
jgi:hypothetical protein